MTRNFTTAAVVACLLLLAADCPAAENAAGPSVRYVPMDAPAGTSRAVVVQGLPLVHTRQLLPLDREGKLVGEGAADKQIEQVLDNLKAVLDAAGSGMDKLVRLNVYAMSHETADRTRELLAKRLPGEVRPAMVAILTPLPTRGAVVAVDAVAAAADKGQAVALGRYDAVAGDKDSADAAVLPAGGVAYFSGQPDQGGLAVTAVSKSLATLLARLAQLQLKPADVVQVKVFLSPASSADAAMAEVKKLFPGQLAPPVVFVEWIASAPVEIELIARLPLVDKPADTVEFYNPPEVIPSPTFSRVALVRTNRQIYISGLASREPGAGEAQCRDVFAQLQPILAETGSDMRHLVKATYYVIDDESGKGFDRVRPELFDPRRPPAASKVTIHGVGAADRTLAMDMIAVGSK